MRNVGKGLSPLIIFGLLALLPLSGMVIIFSIAYLLYERQKLKNEVSVFIFLWSRTKTDIGQIW